MSNKIIFYSAPEGNKKVEITFQDENFRLTQKAIAGKTAAEIINQLF